MRQKINGDGKATISVEQSQKPNALILYSRGWITGWFEQSMLKYMYSMNCSMLLQTVYCKYSMISNCRTKPVSF